MKKREKKLFLLFPVEGMFFKTGTVSWKKLLMLFFFVLYFELINFYKPFGII